MENDSLKENTLKLNFPEVDHRNFVPFRGIAAYIDKPSERAVHLSNFEKQTIEDTGAPILFTRAATENALSTLLGMGLCFQEGSYQNHAPRSKCGVITEAWIEGNQLLIRGGIYGLDFPDVILEMQSNERLLALCPMVRDTIVDADSLPKLVSLKHFTFTGVALMRVGCTAFDNTKIRLGKVPAALADLQAYENQHKQRAALTSTRVI
jgi:hypothetical protein